MWSYLTHSLTYTCQIFWTKWFSLTFLWPPTLFFLKTYISPTDFIGILGLMELVLDHTSWLRRLQRMLIEWPKNAQCFQCRNIYLVSTIAQFEDNTGNYVRPDIYRCNVLWEVTVSCWLRALLTVRINHVNCVSNYGSTPHPATRVFISATGNENIRHLTQHIHNATHTIT